MMKKTLFGYLFSLTILVFTPVMTEAATIAIKAPAQVVVGQVFQVVLGVNNADAIDTVRLNGTYDDSLLELLSMATTDQLESRSPSTYFLQKNGTFSYGAFSLDNPKQGSVNAGVFTFRAKKVGTAKVEINQGSLVLSSGDNQLQNAPSASIKIVAPSAQDPIRVTSTNPVIRVESTSHPMEDGWYPTRDIIFSWNITGTDIVSTSFGIDQLPEGPATNDITLQGETRVSVDGDGIYFLHFIAKKRDGSSIRFDRKIQIDTVAPRPFGLSVDYERVASSTLNKLYFAALDDGSGIHHYSIQDNGRFYTTTTENAVLVTGLEGEHEFLVIAYDYAGNQRSAKQSFIFGGDFLITASATGIRWLWWLLLILFFIILFTGFFVGILVKRNQEKQRKIVSTKRAK